MALSPSDRRALRWGAIVSIAAIVYAFGGRPLLAWRETWEHRLGEARGLVLRYREAASATEIYRGESDSIAVLLRAVAEQSLGGRSPEEASAELLALLHATAREASVSVRRTNLLPPDSVELGFLRVGAVVEGETDVLGLLHFLRSLESGHRLLHVVDLRVSPSNAAAFGSAAGGGPEVLPFTVTAHGFWMVPLAEIGSRAVAGEASR